ncbi:hypothetical protein FA13DRAFT_368542 [Coprinellus micaceus]|uniref:Uncharacterized protein n=1 Tax=Coprinellus micaceus TaxID=71717 RepID=A0A4Y7TB93_COPMI|nr:hypothetical protein FA13DRAFT_368542 [Coprinellus micaceus]
MIFNCLANLVLLSVVLHALAAPVAEEARHLHLPDSTGGLDLRPRCIGSWWCFGRNSNTPPPQPPRFSDLTVINEADVPYRGNSAETTCVPSNTYPPPKPVVPNAAAGGSQSASITGKPGGSAYLGQGGLPSIASDATRRIEHTGWSVDKKQRSSRFKESHRTTEFSSSPQREGSGEQTFCEIPTEDPVSEAEAKGTEGTRV